MTVRRLHHEQPESFAFNAENAAWAEMVIKRYPEGREASAVIPLLWRGQEQEGWVTEPMIRAIADMLGMATIRVLEVATFYTMFHLAPVGRTAHIQVCGTTPCQLRGAEDLVKVCKSRIAAHPHEVSADGQFSWEEVECLGACVNAPMVQVFKDTYEDLTPESLNALIDGFAAGNPPAPGPQNGRQYSVPEGGEVTLLDPALYDGSVVGKYRAYARDPEPAAPAASAPAPATAPAPAASSPAPAAEERVSDEFRPELVAAPRDGKPDDLKLISGVGPKLEAMLNHLGIWHFDQIAAWDEKNVAWVDQHLGNFRGRAARDRWIEQAGKLATGWRPSDKGGAPD